MTTTSIFLCLALLGFGFYLLGRWRAMNASVISGKLHSLPSFHGAYVAMCMFVPVLVVIIAWLLYSGNSVDQQLLNAAPIEIQEAGQLDQTKYLYSIITPAVQGLEVSDSALAAQVTNFQELTKRNKLIRFILILLAAVLGGLWGLLKIKPDFRARNQFESGVKYLLMACSLIAILTTIGIVLSVLFESIRFFNKVPLHEFLFGTQWSPQIAIRADQVGSSGAFGVIPLVTGTLLIATLAMLVAAPIGLMAAIYLSEYASSRVRSVAKPMLEILAGIPTVVYGFFAALTVAPFLRNWGDSVGLTISSESALAAGVVMGVMIIPYVSSLSDDAINAVPNSLREGAYGLGSTKSETIKQVIFPAALPGIVSALLLAVSRAIGETMIVVMAAGLAANLTANPFESVTTITVQIVTLLVGDQEFDSPKTLAAFALGLSLFIVTLCLNIIALRVVRKYRERYD